MFTIQYQAPNGEHKMQTFNGSSRYHLIRHLARFSHPIMAVYEQTTPITKAIRTELARSPVNRMSRAALDFLAPARDVRK